jgi:hypothetical protein
MNIGPYSARKVVVPRNPSFDSAAHNKLSNSRSVIPVFGDFTNDETDLSVLDSVKEARNISQSLSPSINYEAELQRSSARPMRR